MNPFQSSYFERLRDWKKLRDDTKDKSLEEICENIDKWWQQAPLINHYLHPNDTQYWLNPWEILSENTYCLLTRAMGICYTMLLLNYDDIVLATATDDIGEEHFIVIVCSKYIMNYYPNTVISNKLNNFTIKKKLSLEILKSKLK